MLDSKNQTFLAVVELGSYTAAAQVLHLTQPAVTQHIQKLEQHYACKLMDSSGRGARPTKAGQLLYEYLSLQQANQQRFQGIMANLTQPLTLGATLSIADYYLPQRLVEYMLGENKPLGVVVSNTAHLLEQLHKGQLDCALIEGRVEPTLLESRVFSQAHFIPVVAKGHPLAGQKISLQQLHQYPLALREPHSGTRDILESWLGQQNDSPLSFAKVVELGSFVLLKEYVRRSLGVTFVYDAVVGRELESGQLATLDLEGFPLSHPLLFVFRRGDPRQRLLLELFERLGRS